MSLILNMGGGRRHRRGGRAGTLCRRSVHRAGAVIITVLALVASACTSGDEGAGGALATTVAGGLFLDQAVLADQEITGQVVVDALLSAETPEGERMMADAFQGFAVSFSRYC